MIYDHTSKPVTLASKDVPNGRWGDHHVSVETQNGEYFYRDGYSDPLMTDRETAFRFFNENEGRT